MRPRDDHRRDVLAISPMPMPWFDPDAIEFGVFVDTRGNRPTVRASVDQDGKHRKEVDLTYDERRGGYIGRYPAQRDAAPNFSLDLETISEQGKTVHTNFSYTGALFQSSSTPFWSSSLLTSRSTWSHNPACYLRVKQCSRERPLCRLHRRMGWLSWAALTASRLAKPRFPLPARLDGPFFTSKIWTTE